MTEESFSVDLRQCQVIDSWLVTDTHTRHDGSNTCTPTKLPGVVEAMETIPSRSAVQISRASTDTSSSTGFLTLSSVTIFYTCTQEH